MNNEESRKHQCSRCRRLFKYKLMKIGEYWCDNNGKYKLQDSLSLCDSCFEKFERWIDNEGKNKNRN